MLGEVAGNMAGWGNDSYLSVGSEWGGFSDPVSDRWSFRKTLGSLPNYAQLDPDYGKLAYSHPGGLNYVFLDMHVARYVEPPHTIWGNTMFVYNGNAMTAFSAGGWPPLSR